MKSVSPMRNSFVFLLLTVRVCTAFVLVPLLSGVDTRGSSSDWSLQSSTEWKPSEIVPDDDDSVDEDWIPDRDKARQKSARKRIYAERIQPKAASVSSSSESTAQQTASAPSPYTDEEEDLIAAMGGKTRHKSSKREEGYLGDSTLSEICTDYSVPISYLADVLCTWGVPVPINVNDRLGDLVTGEQAFAILEAIYTLDIGALHDRYADNNLEQLCYTYNIDLKDAFEFIMKEGWNLPFGVQTCLRVEQEEELIRLLGDHVGFYEDDDDY